MRKVFIIILLFSLVYVIGKCQIIPESHIIEEMFFNDTVRAINSCDNFLYVGVDNYLYVHPDVKQKNVFFKTDNGIIFDDEGMFCAIPAEFGIVNLDLFQVSGNDTVLLLSKKFPAFEVPPPTLMIGGFKVTELERLSWNILMNCDSLGIFISDDIIGVQDWIYIEKFTFGYDYGSYYVSHSNRGNKFTEEIKEDIKKLKPGQEISIRVWLGSKGNIIREIPIFRINIY